MSRTAHCHLVAKVLAADGIMQQAERELLERCMTRMGLSAEERDQVIHFEGADDAEAAMRALPEAERRALVDELVEAALIDGKLSPQEMEIVKRVTEALDL